MAERDNVVTNGTERAYDMEKSIDGPKKVAPGRIRDLEKMKTTLQGFFWAIGMNQALRAMEYMLKRHEGHYRKGGQPYAVHPLAMAKHAMLLYHAFPKHISEDVFVAIFLHDVCEEAKRLIEELPFGGKARRDTQYLTITRFSGDTRFTEKMRYAQELRRSLVAVIVKLLDTIDNLSTMVGIFPDQKIRKNVVEKDQIFFGVFEEAMKDFPDASALILLLLDEARRLNDMLAIYYEVQLKDEHFVNAPDAEDYSELIQ